MISSGSLSPTAQYITSFISASFLTLPSKLLKMPLTDSFVSLSSYSRARISRFIYLENYLLHLQDQLVKIFRFLAFWIRFTIFICHCIWTANFSTNHRLSGCNFAANFSVSSGPASNKSAKQCASSPDCYAELSYFTLRPDICEDTRESTSCLQCSKTNHFLQNDTLLTSKFEYLSDVNSRPTRCIIAAQAKQPQ